MEQLARYTDAIRGIDASHPFAVTDILNIGRPDFSLPQGTACIAFDPKQEKGDGRIGKGLSFMFNADFFDWCDDDALRFVLAHGCLHVVLRHPKLFVKNVDWMKIDVFNEAADCVINDLLIAAGFKPGNLDEVIFRGESSVGYDCSRSSVTDVYMDILMKQQHEEKQSQGEGAGAGSGGPGEEGEGKPGMVDDHSSWTEAQVEAIERMISANPALRDALRDAAQKCAGLEGSVNMPYALDETRSLNWNSLLKKVDPDIMKKVNAARVSYARPRRKSAGVERIMGGARLPVSEKSKEKGKVHDHNKTLLMFVDTSGSCRDDVPMFIALAKSVPEEVNLICYEFNSIARRIDIDNPQLSSGGTDFGQIAQAVEEYSRTELKGRRPKAVVVVTDGHGSFYRGRPPADAKETWHWLISEGGSSRYGIVGHSYRLKDFVL